jgi:hypothetical protein
MEVGQGPNWGCSAKEKNCNRDVQLIQSSSLEPIFISHASRLYVTIIFILLWGSVLTWRRAVEPKFSSNLLPGKNVNTSCTER